MNSVRTRRARIGDCAYELLHKHHTRTRQAPAPVPAPAPARAFAPRLRVRLHQRVKRHPVCHRLPAQTDRLQGSSCARKLPRTHVLHDTHAVRVLRGICAHLRLRDLVHHAGQEHRGHERAVPVVLMNAEPKRCCPRREDDAAEHGAERDEVGDDVPIGGQKVRATVMMLPGSKPSPPTGMSQRDEMTLRRTANREYRRQRLERARVDLLGELEAIEFRLVVYILFTSRGSDWGPASCVHEAVWSVTRKYVRERRQRIYEGLDASTSPRLGPYQETMRRLFWGFDLAWKCDRMTKEELELVHNGGRRLGRTFCAPTARINDRDLVNRTLASSRLITASSCRRTRAWFQRASPTGDVENAKARERESLETPTLERSTRTTNCLCDQSDFCVTTNRTMPGKDRSVDKVLMLSWRASTASNSATPGTLTTTLLTLGIFIQDLIETESAARASSEASAVPTVGLIAREYESVNVPCQQYGAVDYFGFKQFSNGSGQTAGFAL
ncbi:hypothetical protein B0H13DRAFT_1855843 [Mycena leptocephala]|nr:hypothetical protein B0H13DRAFT_1855843 [Mycena leptocephala]